jgi:uncharacterized protein YcsI (UPF0317 family)
MAKTIDRGAGNPDSVQVAQFPDDQPATIRLLAREGLLRGSNTQAAPGFAQATFIAFKQELALDFITFCQRNPAPAPLLEIMDPGDPIVRRLAPGADVRTDIPRYRVYEHGRLVATPYDVREYWQDDMVGFMIGCSCTFEHLLIASGVRLRHIEEGQTGTIYLTTIQCQSAGRFSGPMAVSFRPIHWTQVSRTVQLCSRFPAYHGAPIHFGDPTILGIADLAKPWYGDIPRVEDDEVGVYWACSVTPQIVALRAGMSFITNEPGSMFLTDVPMQEMAAIL